MLLWLISVAVLAPFIAAVPYMAKTATFSEAASALGASSFWLLIGGWLIHSTPSPTERAGMYPAVAVVLGFLILDAITLYWVNKRLKGDWTPT